MTTPTPPLPPTPPAPAADADAPGQDLDPEEDIAPNLGGEDRMQDA